jgi:hypothetical protein
VHGSLFAAENTGMKVHPYVVMGILFIALGITALVHPNVSMPSKKSEMEIAGTKTIIETTRIIQIPKVFSVLLLVAGGSFIFLSTAKSKSGKI